MVMIKHKKFAVSLNCIWWCLCPHYLADTPYNFCSNSSFFAIGKINTSFSFAYYSLGHLYFTFFFFFNIFGVQLKPQKTKKNAAPTINRQQRPMWLVETLRQNWHQVSVQVSFWHQTLLQTNTISTLSFQTLMDSRIVEGGLWTIFLFDNVETERWLDYLAWTFVRISCPCSISKFYRLLWIYTWTLH